jgi:hypothetical protein
MMAVAFIDAFRLIFFLMFPIVRYMGYADWLPDNFVIFVSSDALAQSYRSGP